MAHATYFASSTEPKRLPAARESLGDFVQRHAERRIALVTSGGTTVPLEKNTVRFIDNFSTGNRGAASVEQLLKADYAVVFVYRTHSAFPFARQFTPPTLSAEQLLQRAGTEAHAALVTAAAAEYAQHAPRLLALPFTSVDEYLHLLRAACVALAAAGPRALLYLAAAVSDFFIPEHELSTHKIQSGGGDGARGGGGTGGGGGGTGDGGGGGDGGLELHLRPVPKLLAAIKRGGGERSTRRRRRRARSLLAGGRGWGQALRRQSISACEPTTPCRPRHARSMAGGAQAARRTSERSGSSELLC